MSRHGSIPAPETIADTILTLAARRGAGKTICPSEVARALGGDKPEGWSPLMGPVRREAVRLMKAGRISILRKGRPVDPDDFRGVYRIAAAGDDDASGEGNKAVVRPDSL